MIALASPKRENKMTAIITETSETVETRILDVLNGREVSTTYHNSLDLAINQAEMFGVESIQLEEMSI